MNITTGRSCKWPHTVSPAPSAWRVTRGATISPRTYLSAARSATASVVTSIARTIGRRQTRAAATRLRKHAQSGGRSSRRTTTAKHEFTAQPSLGIFKRTGKLSMHPHIPPRDLWWLAAGGASYGVRYARLRLRLARPPPPRAPPPRAHRAGRGPPTPDPTGELLRLQTLYGYNEHSLVSIAPGARLWSVPEIDGAIIYGEFGRAWLA